MLQNAKNTEVLKEKDCTWHGKLKSLCSANHIMQSIKLIDLLKCEKWPKDDFCIYKLKHSAYKYTCQYKIRRWVVNGRVNKLLRTVNGA